jgi:EF hand
MSMLVRLSVHDKERAMLNRLTIGMLVAAGAACSLITLPACAQMMRGNPGQFLEKADQNEDGVITRAEYQTSRVAAFDKLDRNDDGFVDSNDAPRRRRAQAQGGERLAALREQLDKDGDGRVSREEFANGPMLMFDRADGNHDGQLDAQEIKAFKEAMQAAKEARG